MPDLSLVILYVDNLPASLAFYSDLLEQPSAGGLPTFAMFKLPSGIGIGLWSRHTVQPAAASVGGGGELAFTTNDADALHADWASRGIPIAQPPTDLDFGRSFVALDPDGHRLRVFAPPAR